MKIKPMSIEEAKRVNIEANEWREKLIRASIDKLIEELQDIGDLDLVDAKEREVHLRVVIK